MLCASGPLAIAAPATANTASPQFTSVEAGTTKTFSAAFREPDGQASVGAPVTFANDACGTFSNGLFNITVPANAQGIASAAFTAFSSGAVTCQVTATSGSAQVVFQVITYRPEFTTVVVTTDPAVPRAGERFVVDVSLMIGARRLYDVDLSLRAASGSTPVALIPHLGNTWPTGSLALAVIPERVGDVTLEVMIGARVVSIPIRFEAATLALQDMWWTQPQENGWGIAIVQHRDTLMMVIFSYDAAGKPVWYVMPGGSWDAARQVYTGSLYRPRGSPFYAYDASRFVPGAPVGPVKLTFNSGNSAKLEGSVDGVTFTRSITRMSFGVFELPPFPAQGDLWWGGSAQNGWGISVIQQHNTFFSVWYTYDADGAVTWYVMPGGRFTSANTYEGRIFRTAGSPFVGVTYDPARFQSTDVGSYRLRFPEASGPATFDYTIDGRSGTLTLSRQPF